MGTFWSFLLQTLTASGVALFLLVLKELFRDKLSPRWQFSVWGILGLVLLIPAGRFGRHLLLDWPLWLDTLKGYWFGDFSRTEVFFPIPLMPKGFPRNIADWLFLVYLVGVFFFVFRYLFSYIRLRSILKQGQIIADLPELTALQQSYKLPRCKAVRVSGIDSAFVCGVLRPVLVIPADRETDPKVLLHELLHLKNRDVVWGIVIAFFRCIHWCNPLLWYCADQALNDMEALCDQRVLEQLEGEDRREYGKILLSMANDAYARTPGTSSAANGGSNIRKRIEAIARFKRYPKGMGLVSVCILVTLIGPLLIGSRTDAAIWQSAPGDGNGFALVKSLTAARQTPCTSFAGALDSYAKALLSNNAAYRMLSLSDAQQEKLLAQAREGNPMCWLDTKPEPLYAHAGYWVYGLRKTEDGHWEALLVFEPVQQADSPRMRRLCTQKVAMIWENGRWNAEPLGDFQYVEDSDGGPLRYGCRDLPTTVYTGEAGDFQIRLQFQQCAVMDNWELPQKESPIFSSGEPFFQTIPNPNLEITSVFSTHWVQITYTGPQEGRAQMTQIGLSMAPWEEGTAYPVLPVADGAHSARSAGNGVWEGIHLSPGWENPIDLGGGGSSDVFRMEEENPPSRFAAALYLNGEKTAELELLPEDQP